MAFRIEFDKYRFSPEFKKLNPNMTFEEFKFIYYMEWLHRNWGRLVGLTFLLPTAYFIYRRRVSLPIARNLILINAFIGVQGFVGWWMVKSGLKDDLFADGQTPRVSQYRLMVHMGLAFALYGSMLWNGLQVSRELHLANNTQPQRAAKLLDRLRSPKLRLFRGSLMATTGLIFTTAMAGALVAGLDAGLIYNEFPYMGLGLTPPASELWSSFYSRLPTPHPDLWWRNVFENPSLVQLNHRILAVSTFTAVNALWLYARLSPVVQASLPRGAKLALHGTLGMVWVQLGLGLGTLLYLVPTPLASAHQAGALALLTSAIILGSRVWSPPRLARLVNQRYKAISKSEIATAQSARATAQLRSLRRSRPG